MRSVVLALTSVVTSSVLAALSSSLQPAQAQVTFVNGLTLDGGLLDRSGGTSVNNGRVGFFSDLYFDPNRNEWWGLSDRGPGGGTLSYDTRVQRFSLAVDPASGAISNFNIEETVLFRDGLLPFNGLAPNPSGVLGQAFDPEGFVILPKSGHFLVSDEYGPSVVEFARDGQFIRRFEVPDNLVPRAGGSPDYTATAKPGNLTSGRENNRGLEGLAISPDGRFAYAMLQNGTIADGNSSGSSFARSMYTRILKYDVAGGNVVSQFAYRLDGSGPAPAQSRGSSAIASLDENRLLVIERNNRGIGVDSNRATPDKKVYLMDLTGATDVTGVALNSLAPAGVIPVAKTTPAFIDLSASSTLADSSLAALGGYAPEKWEGLTIGPQLADGSYVLVAGTDNDYSVTQNSNGTQFDVFYNPTTGARAQCDLGTTINCTAIGTNGSLGSAIGDLPSGYALIPGVLQAYKADLQAFSPYVAPVPGPLPLLGAATGLAWSRRLRQRIRKAQGRTGGGLQSNGAPS